MSEKKDPANVTVEKKKTTDSTKVEKPKSVAKVKEPPKDELKPPAKVPAKKNDTATVKRPVKKSTRTSNGFCVYLGPSIRGVITHGAVFSDTKEKAIAELSIAIDKHPLIADLIVPGETLPEDRIKVKNAGNLLNVKYKQLAAEQ